MSDSDGLVPVAGEATGAQESGQERRKRGHVATLTNAGKGRPKGSRNRASVEIGAMVDKALSEAGGWRYLLAQAHANPNAFLALVARRLPKELRAEITAEMTVRQETRRELIERSVALMLAIETGAITASVESDRRSVQARAISEARALLTAEDERTARAMMPSDAEESGEGANAGGARASGQLSPLAGRNA